MELNQCLQKLVSHFSNLMKDDDNGSDLLNEEFWVSMCPIWETNKPRRRSYF